MSSAYATWVMKHDSCFRVWKYILSTPGLLTETSHLHYISKLASYKGQPFVVGHFEFFAGNSKTELLDFDTQAWSQMADYPFHEA